MRGSDGSFFRIFKRRGRGGADNKRSRKGLGIHSGSGLYNGGVFRQSIHKQVILFKPRGVIATNASRFIREIISGERVYNTMLPFPALFTNDTWKTLCTLDSLFSSSKVTLSDERVETQKGPTHKGSSFPL
jgi:hypothetical protein